VKAPLCESEALKIQVAHSSAPGATDLIDLEMHTGATVADALAAVDAASRWPALPQCTLAVWNRRAQLRTLLRDGDRVEVLRPLTADPKESRRQRYRATPGRQGGIERGRK
jgi:putative ubiquitin-RnfH superfamily antitoxin RatB of RatAB toxin-antitoxin module